MVSILSNSLQIQYEDGVNDEPRFSAVLIRRICMPNGRGMIEFPKNYFAISYSTSDLYHRIQLNNLTFNQMTQIQQDFVKSFAICESSATEMFANSHVFTATEPKFWSEQDGEPMRKLMAARPAPRIVSSFFQTLFCILFGYCIVNCDCKKLSKSENEMLNVNMNIEYCEYDGELCFATQRHWKASASYDCVDLFDRYYYPSPIPSPAPHPKKTTLNFIISRIGLREQLVLKGAFDIFYSANNICECECECGFNENFYNNGYIMQHLLQYLLLTIHLQNKLVLMKQVMKWLKIMF